MHKKQTTGLFVTLRKLIAKYMSYQMHCSAESTVCHTVVMLHVNRKNKTSFVQCDLKTRKQLLPVI